MLNKMNVPIILDKGIDTKTSKKALQGKLLVLENGIFQTGMEIRKRNGYIALPSLGAGVMLSPYNNELVTLDGQSLYSYNQASGTQINKGSLPIVSLATQTVIRNTNQQTAQDSAKNGTLQCFTWTDSGGGLRYSVFDSATGQSIVNNAVVDASGDVSKVLAIGTKFVILYTVAASNLLRYKAIDTTTPTTLGSAATITNDLNSSTSVFDATVINGSIFLAYNPSASRISLFSISSSLVVSTKVNFGSEGASTISIFTDASFNVWVSYAVTGGAGTDTKVNVFALNNAMNSTVLAKTVVESFQVSAVGPLIQNITGSVVSTTATIYYEVTQAAIVAGMPLNYVRQNTVTTGGSVGTASDFFRAASLASKMFQYQSTFFVLLAFQSNLQPSYFLIRADGLNVSKVSPSEGGGYTTARILPEMNSFGSGLFQTASLVKDSVTVQNGIISAQTGVLSASLTFTTLAPAKFALGQNLHVAGSMVKMYDGGTVVEHGFNLFPEGLYSTWDANTPTFNGGVGIGASMASINSKQYCAVYEWTDNEGQAHQSAPSVPISVLLPTQNAVTTITGDLNGAVSPPHNGNTITNASGGAVGQYVNLVSASGKVTFGWNAKITSKVSTTLTLDTAYFLVASSGNTFLLSDYPLSLYFTAVPNPSIIAPGFGAVNPIFGQTIVAAGGNSNYPPDTWFKSSAYSSITGLFDTNNPPTGVGTTNMYYGQGTFTIPIKIPTLKFTDKQKVSIAVYATLNNGTIFYRTSSPTSLLYNDKTVDYVEFDDVTPDNTLIGNQELYTTSGEVENIGVPAINVATTFKSRAIVVPSENQLSWWPSKQVIPGSPVEFSDLFVQNIDSRIQKITAASAMDDKLIFLGPTSTFYVVGNGPALNGTNNDYTEAQLISSDVGCENQASVILMPFGLMFQSQKGIYLLDRSLAVQYIGADVEDFNEFTVTSAQLMDEVNQVRFTLNNGTELVYDYFYKQWDVFASLSANDSGIFQNQHTIIKSTGVVWQESPGVYSDAGSVIPLHLVTAWMSFANIQGFQRVYSFLLLGDYKSPHTLTINIYTDFDDTTPAQTVTIPVLSDPGQYQFRVFLTKQKTESVKIEILESQDSPGEGLSITSMAFIVGVKQGLYKLPAAKSYS